MDLPAPVSPVNTGSPGAKDNDRLAVGQAYLGWNAFPWLALEAGRKHGMVSFTDALADFVRTGLVDVREAFRKAPDRDRLLDVLKRDSVDTSVVERLA